MNHSTLSLIFIGLNIGLLALKLSIGWQYNSLAVLGDAGNSLVDIITATVIFLAVREAAKPADCDHPFGHARAEPLAAFTVAVLTFVLAFEVGREAIGRLITGESAELGLAPALALLGVIAVKSGMWLAARLSGRKDNSPALAAFAADAQMDVVISLLALVGVATTNLGWPTVDAWAALAIAAWIGWTGWQIGRVNIEKLLGKTPDPVTMQLVHTKLKLLKKQKRIRNFHELRAHYVGSSIHIALHIDVDRDLTLEQTHALDEEIQEYFKSVPGVADVAVHVDPV